MNIQHSDFIPSRSRHTVNGARTGCMLQELKMAIMLKKHCRLYTVTAFRKKCERHCLESPMQLTTYDLTFNGPGVKCRNTRFRTNF